MGFMVESALLGEEFWRSHNVNVLNTTGFFCCLVTKLHLTLV